MMPYMLSGLGASSFLKALKGARVLVHPSLQLLAPLSVLQHVLPSVAAASTSANNSQQRDSREHDWKQSPIWTLSGLAALATAQGFPTALAEPENTAPPPMSSSVLPPTSQPQSGGPSNDSTAQWRLYTNIGQELFQKGRTKEAEGYFKRALQEAKKGFGEADAHVAAACNNLAEFYRVTRQPEKAEPLYLEGLRLFEGAYGKKDVRFAQAMHNMAGFYFLQKSFTRSQQYYREALQAKAETLGVNHPSYADTLMRLGDALRLGGQKEDALAVLRQALELQDALGPQAPGSLTTASRLGQLLLGTGRGEEGEAVLRRVLQQAQDMNAANEQAMPSWHLAIYVENVAHALIARSNLTGARDLLHQALGLRRAEDRGTGRLGDALLNLAKLELLIGGRDGQLRAHNLAKQAVALSTAAWERLLQMRAASSPGWFSSLWNSAPAIPPLSEDGDRRTVVAAINIAKACHVAGEAELQLGRPEEAGDTFFRGLEAVMHESARPAGISTPVAEDEDPVAVEKELVRLHYALMLAHDIASNAAIVSSLDQAALLRLSAYADSLHSMVPKWHGSAKPLAGASSDRHTSSEPSLQLLQQAMYTLESARADRNGKHGS